MYEQEKVMPYAGEAGGKREQVERMFDGMAKRYDALNHVMSVGVDRIWRKNAIGWLKKQLGKDAGSAVILDVATGTGDFALLAQKKLCPKKIVGIDISEGMMAVGREKAAKQGCGESVVFQQEDCSALSFADGTFDAVISSFGLRNFANLDQCLSEMLRVLKPGGRIVCIDLCTPRSFPMKQLFGIYRKTVMPLVTKAVTHDDKGSTYLPETMDAIPQGEEMAGIFAKAGFKETAAKALAFGICQRYTGRK